MTETTSINAIFFDNDGVLVATEPLYFRASRDVLGQAGIELTWEAFQAISLGLGQSVFLLAEEAGVGEDALEQMRQKRNRLYADMLSSERLVIEGVERTLERLHGRVPMAIVTSSLKAHFDIIHDSSGLLGYFDFVLTREDYRLSKPNPEPYLKALRKSGHPPERCLVVEDSKRGFQAARAAGIPCLVISEEPYPSGFDGAHDIRSDFSHLPALLPPPGA